MRGASTGQAERRDRVVLLGLCVPLAGGPLEHELGISAQTLVRLFASSPVGRAAVGVVRNGTITTGAPAAAGRRAGAPAVMVPLRTTPTAARPTGEEAKSVPTFAR